MERRTIDFQDFQSAIADVQHLHGHGYDAAGHWNLAQICDHLSTTMDRSIDGFEFRAPFLVRLLIAPWFKRLMYRYRTIKAGLKAPAGMVPAAGGDEAPAVERFAEAARRIDQHRGPFQDHPVFGKLTHEQWRQFHLIHAAHHLSFVVGR